MEHFPAYPGQKRYCVIMAKENHTQHSILDTDDLGQAQGVVDDACRVKRDGVHRIYIYDRKDRARVEQRVFEQD